MDPLGHIVMCGNLRGYANPPSRERSCFRSRNMVTSVIADVFFAFRRKPAGEIEWPKQSRSVGVASFVDLIDYPDKPTGQCTASLGQYEPHRAPQGYKTP